MKIYKNFLPKKDFKRIKEHIMGVNMPWYWSNGVLHPFKQEPISNFQFVYVFILNSKQNCHPDMIYLLNPIISKLEFKQMRKIKANIVTRTSKIIEHGMHSDKKVGKTGIFYLNTCNGYTKFEDGTKIISEENKYIEFKSKLKHTGSSCTDERRRVVINFNYV